MRWEVLLTCNDHEWDPRVQCECEQRPPPGGDCGAARRTILLRYIFPIVSLPVLLPTQPKPPTDVRNIVCWGDEVPVKIVWEVSRIVIVGKRSKLGPPVRFLVTWNEAVAETVGQNRQMGLWLLNDLWLQVHCGNHSRFKESSLWVWRVLKWPGIWLSVQQ